ncbi:MAG: MarR family transcriptional regulator [Burkholderiales bacterium PBB3]|nr:MAG: MarR family transcriptional regulator [Burkholderiales bacterium PBB3]
MPLSETSQKFILHWGEMGARWGVNRTVAQIHALLYLTGKPLPADEIADTLNVARSNVSNSIRELQAWNLVKLVHVMGERRDHFECSTDIWELSRTVVRERQERELMPTIAMLRELLNHPEIMLDGVERANRMREMLMMLETLTVWSDEMLRLDTETLTKVLKLGAKIQKLIRGDGGSAKVPAQPAGLQAMGSIIGP